MEMDEVLKQGNTKVIHTRKLTVEEHIENFNVIHNDKAMKKLACEYAKLTLTIEKYYSLIELYGCTSFDREIFVKLYEKWLDTYLTYCAKGLHKYYLTETVQDFYHTCKAELSE